MKKIPTLFQRDPVTHKVNLDEVTFGCGWVLDGGGVPTRKLDGVCVMCDGERWWARREVKPGKTAPPGWVQVDHDKITGKRQGWEPIEQSGRHGAFLDALEGGGPAAEGREGTYELIGPKINGNPENVTGHLLVPHSREVLSMERYDLAVAVSYAKGIAPTPEALVETARRLGFEGVVWHHPDGRMAKLKVRDIDWGTL